MAPRRVAGRFLDVRRLTSPQKLSAAVIALAERSECLLHGCRLVGIVVRSERLDVLEDLARVACPPLYLELDADELRSGYNRDWDDWGWSHVHGLCLPSLCPNNSDWTQATARLMGLLNHEKLPGLADLDTIGTPVTGLRVFCGLSRLKVLRATIVARRGDGELLSPIQRIRNLRVLEVHGNMVGSLGPLRRSLRLERRAAARCSSRKGMYALATLRHLRVLVLSGFGGDLAPLAGCRHLWSLTLEMAAPATGGELLDFPALRRLCFRRCVVGDVLGSFRDCVAINSLEVADCDVSDIAVVARWRHLRRLVLRRLPVSDISVLARCTYLESLDIHGTDVESVAALAHCAWLTKLLMQNTKVRDLAPLASCRRLGTLDVRDTPVDSLAPLGQCVGLATLLISSRLALDPSLGALRGAAKVTVCW